MNRRQFARILASAPFAYGLAACAQPATPAPTVAPSPVPQSSPSTDLSGIKQYLSESLTILARDTTALKDHANSYYQLADASAFDYAALWKAQPQQVAEVISAARSAWMAASPGYERVEGIVAGVPSLAEFDLILDAGSSGAEGGDSVVPFDLKLPNGQVLAKPGNLFGVTESTLWGTEPSFQGGVADLDGDGSTGFGDTLPEANVLKAATETLDSYVQQLIVAAGQWQPNEADAFTALVTMVPTMSEYFDSWKNSRFVAGERSTQRDFVAISRLADIQEILGGLQIVHQGVSPLIRQVDTSEDSQIGQELADLKSFVADVAKQEQDGRRYTAEEADTLGAEAQNRATAITGRITQIAARLNIAIAS
jgi:hypothetical protein